MYTEKLINDELAGTPIHVSWDGNEPERDEPTRFHVSYGDEDTDLVLWDSYGSTDIYEYIGNSSYRLQGYVTRYSDLREVLGEIINEAVVAGKLGGAE